MAKDLDERLRQTVGEKIRCIRRANGLSQSDAAGRTTLSVDGWSRLERGAATNPALSMYVEVSEALGVGIRDLLPEEASATDDMTRELAVLLAAVGPETQRSLLDAVKGLLQRPKSSSRT